VQRRDGAMLATAAALLRMEVGDEARTVGRLGQAGWEAKWAGRWCQFGMAKHYWVVCDHEMLNYCGIFQCLSQLKGLEPEWPGCRMSTRSRTRVAEF
jgi:hypothetical protein